MVSEIMTTDMRTGKGSVRRSMSLSKPPVMGTDDPATAAAVVSGAGTTEANGTYTMRGTYTGKNYYNLVGQPDEVGSYSIVWTGGEWQLKLAPETDGSAYLSLDDVLYPWLITTWFAADSGVDPVPTVTMGSS